MLLHGIHPVREALRSRLAKPVEFFFQAGKPNPRLTGIEKQATSAGIALTRLPAAELTSRCNTDRHQGVAVEVVWSPLPDHIEYLTGDADLLVLADGVEDPQNLGALIRTAEAVGAAAVLLPRHRSCGLTPTVVKSSAGAALHLPVVSIGNAVQLLGAAKKNEWWVAGLDMDGSAKPPDLDPQLRWLIVVGGEDRGLRPLLRRHCDFVVSLPQKGKVSSLNLSVAAGVLLYQIALGKE